MSRRTCTTCGAHSQSPAAGVIAGSGWTTPRARASHSCPSWRHWLPTRRPEHNPRELLSHDRSGAREHGVHGRSARGLQQPNPADGHQPLPIRQGDTTALVARAWLAGSCLHTDPVEALTVAPSLVRVARGIILEAHTKPLMSIALRGSGARSTGTKVSPVHCFGLLHWDCRMRDTWEELPATWTRIAMSRLGEWVRKRVGLTKPMAVPIPWCFAPGWGRHPGVRVRGIGALLPGQPGCGNCNAGGHLEATVAPLQRRSFQGGCRTSQTSKGPSREARTPRHLGKP